MALKVVREIRGVKGEPMFTLGFAMASERDYLFSLPVRTFEPHRA